MKLEFEVHKCLCHPKVFRINGINAMVSDFGIQTDQCPWATPEFGCGNMHFTSYKPISEIMKKYKIDESEWHEVCDALNELSFGQCGLCI